jgi:hypothetical protein
LADCWTTSLTSDPLKLMTVPFSVPLMASVVDSFRACLAVF